MATNESFAAQEARPKRDLGTKEATIDAEAGEGGEETSRAVVASTGEIALTTGGSPETGPEL